MARTLSGLPTVLTTQPWKNIGIQMVFVLHCLPKAEICPMPEPFEFFVALVMLFGKG